MKTYKQCCSDVAMKHKLGKSLVTGHLPKYWEEAAEMFADQFKIGKEQWKAIEGSYIDWCFGLGKFASNDGIFQWFRSKIEKQIGDE